MLIGRRAVHKALGPGVELTLYPDGSTLIEFYSLTGWPLDSIALNMDMALELINAACQGGIRYIPGNPPWARVEEERTTFLCGFHVYSVPTRPLIDFLEQYRDTFELNQEEVEER
jgi:hypothetical protein